MKVKSIKFFHTKRICSIIPWQDLSFKNSNRSICCESHVSEENKTMYEGNFANFILICEPYILSFIPVFFIFPCCLSFYYFLFFQKEFIYIAFWKVEPYALSEFIKNKEIHWNLLSHHFQEAYLKNRQKKLHLFIISFIWGIFIQNFVYKIIWNV